MLILDIASAEKARTDAYNIEGTNFSAVLLCIDHQPLCFFKVQRCIVHLHVLYVCVCFEGFTNYLFSVY